MISQSKTDCDEANDHSLEPNIYRFEVHCMLNIPLTLNSYALPKISSVHMTGNDKNSDSG